MNTDQNFKQAVRDRFESIQLDDQQLDQINALQIRAKKIEPKRHFLRWAIAASALLAVMLTSMQMYNPDDILADIAVEVAQNHVRLDKVELQSDQFNLISAHFDKLDFTPRLPEDQFLLSHQNLLGGRYCSIHGGIALQLRYGISMVDSATLYIASPNASVKGELESQLSNHDNRYVTRINDVNVQLWYEQGLLYAVSQQH